MDCYEGAGEYGSHTNSRATYVGDFNVITVNKYTDGMQLRPSEELRVNERNVIIR